MLLNPIEIVADNTGFPRSIQLWDTDHDITTDNILIAYIVLEQKDRNDTIYLENDTKSCLSEIPQSLDSESRRLYVQNLGEKRSNKRK